jgi:hypothetical protein
MEFHVSVERCRFVPKASKYDPSEKKRDAAAIHLIKTVYCIDKPYITFESNNKKNKQNEW